MLKNRLKIFTILGFNIYIDLSWLILAVLIVWSLSAGYFPEKIKNLHGYAYIIMGIFGAFGLFFSIVFHELSHSVFARSYGVKMNGITLFLFGGVAEMENEPEKPMAEFVMGIMGPVSSVVLAGIFALISRLFYAELPAPVYIVLQYLSWINLLLAAFNMIPAFPLDGGRVLRSIIWAFNKNVFSATRISSKFGETFGWFLMIGGGLLFMGTSNPGYIWYFVIGFFLRNAAISSYENVVLKKLLSGVKVSEFLKRDVETVDSSVTVNDFVENHVYKHLHRIFPVIVNGKLTGCADSDVLGNIAREKWKGLTVKDIQHKCIPENTIAPEAPALEAFSRMSAGGFNSLMVTQNDILLGMVRMADIAKYIALKARIEKI